MRTYAKIGGFLLALLMTACASVKVVTDVDKTADFEKYKTYSFLGWQDDSDNSLNEFDKRRIREAFTAEFAERGFVYQEEGADMTISLYIVISNKTSTTAYTDYYSTGGYGRFNRYRGGWGNGYAQTNYEETDYVEGTLVMDAFDSETQEQVWQGIATSTINEEGSKREKTIPRKISSLMNQFPFTAK